MFEPLRWFMSKEFPGNFSANLFSLQIQLKSLFDEAGGESSIKLLDKLSRLSPTEQKLALTLFQKVIERVLSGELRVASERDKFMQELEDSLYTDILDSMKQASGDIPASPSKPTRRLQVVDGGKGKDGAVIEKAIDLKKARESKKVPIKPLIN